jgi:hypothetical protein
MESIKFLMMTQLFMSLRIAHVPLVDGVYDDDISNNLPLNFNKLYASSDISTG